jgi:hypothetical protein
VTTRRRPGRFTIVKDAVTFTLGIAIMGHQLLLVPRADFNLYAWVTAGLLVGVPGAGALMPGLTQAIANRLTTGGGQSSSPPPESPSPPPASSTTSPGAEP